MVKSTRLSFSLLRLFALSASLFCVCTVVAQRSDTGIWDPATKAKPKPTTKPTTKPRPRPVPVRPSPRPAPPPRFTPLTVQYRIFKVNENNSQVEVNPVTIFNRGDRLRFAVKSDTDVYLFVIHQQGLNQPGRIYIPDSQINGGQNLLAKNVEFVIPSGCPAGTAPLACTYKVDGTTGQEMFTLIFSRAPSIRLLDEAVGAGGIVTAQSLDAYMNGLNQRLDDTARGDSVFARTFRNLNPKSADQVVVRLAINKRG